jgi:membrane protein
MWRLGGLSWLQLAKRVWREVQEDNVFGRAAELSYYFLLALFPFLIFLTSIIGFVLGSGTGTRHQLFNYIARIMPPSAFQLLDNTMLEVSKSSTGGKLSFGILAALWAASNGLSAITESLNTAYDVTESRPWWKQRLTAISLTVALSVLIILALVLVVAGGHIADSLAAAYGLGDTFPLAWRIIQWPVVLACMLLAFASIYFFAPDLHKQAWKWLTPGAAIGVALWLLVSIAFRVYLHFFDSYSATYGSLGAVIILMLWLYFTGAAVLIGGEVNSEIESAAARQGEPDAKEKGEKAPDEKPGAAQAA